MIVYHRDAVSSLSLVATVCVCVLCAVVAAAAAAAAASAALARELKKPIKDLANTMTKIPRNLKVMDAALKSFDDLQR